MLLPTGWHHVLAPGGVVQFERAFRLRLRAFSLCRDRGGDGNGFVVRVLGWFEKRQGGFGQVALVGDLPFVVRFDED